MGQFRSNFRVEGDFPTNRFCTDRQVNECHTTLSLTVFTHRNFVSDFILEKCNFRRNTAVLTVQNVPFGGLGAKYDVHLRLIGKHVVDFLLVLIELFSLRVTTEALRANID